MPKTGFLNKMGSLLYGNVEGVLDTVSFGLTDTMTDKLWENTLNKKGAKNLNQFRGAGNIAGAVGGGILTGNVSGAINEGLEGFGDIAGNSKNADFQKAEKFAQLGAQISSFVPSGGSLTNFGSQMANVTSNPMVSGTMGQLNSFVSQSGSQPKQISANVPKDVVYSRKQDTNFRRGGPVKPIVAVNNDYDLTQAPRRGNYLLPDINRPYYINEQGNEVSEYKMGIGVGDKQVIIPTVVNGKQLTQEQAVDRYLKTGLHMGQFDTVEDANYEALLRTKRYNVLKDPVRENTTLEFEDGGLVATPQMPKILQSLKNKNKQFEDGGEVDDPTKPVSPFLPKPRVQPVSPELNQFLQTTNASLEKKQQADREQKMRSAINVNENKNINTTESTRVVTNQFTPEQRANAIPQQNLLSSAYQLGVVASNSIFKRRALPQGLSNKDTAIDLTNIPLGVAKVNQSINGKIILGGEFIEKSNNTVRRAQDWLTAKDTYSDKEYPSANIQSFYGVENGRFKVGKASDFNPNTEIVPRRFGSADISKVVLNDGAMRLLDKSGNPIYQNTPKAGKFILYSPTTGKSQFNYISSGEQGVKRVNDFLKANKDAQYVHLDNGRYMYYGVNPKGLTPQDFKTFYKLDLDRSGHPGYNLVIKEDGGPVEDPVKPGLSATTILPMNPQQFRQYVAQTRQPELTLEQRLAQQRAAEYAQRSNTTESTRIVKPQFSAEDLKQIQEKEEQRKNLAAIKSMQPATEALQRKMRIEAANKALEESLTTSDNWQQLLARQTQATGDKLDVPFLPNWIDPFYAIGSMASLLGAMPYNIQQGNYGQAAMSVAAPLAFGALAGLGTTSTGQFVNNIANPIPLNNLGNYLTTQTPLRNAYKINPRALKENDIEILQRWQADNASNLPEGVLPSNYTGRWYSSNWDNERLIKAPISIPTYMGIRPGSGEIRTAVVKKGTANVPNELMSKTNFPNIERILPENVEFATTRVDTNPVNFNDLKSMQETLLLGRQLSEAALPKPHWLKGYELSKISKNPSVENITPSQTSIRDWLDDNATFINLERASPKPKSKMYKASEVVEDPNFNIKKIYRGDKETPKVIRVQGKSGEWTVNRSKDGSYYFNAAMSNPLESGKAMLKINEMLPPKPVILEPNSLSLDSYLNTIKLGKRPHWKMEFENYIPLNHSAVNNKMLSNKFGFKPEGTQVPFSSLEDANIALKEVNAMLKKQGIAQEADVFSNGNGWYGIKIPNFKLTRDYKKGGLIKRADGSYSKRGLWDNIRANRGSGKKPTAEMLKQERKIKRNS